MEVTKRDNTTPSCAVCQRRKVKCNRAYPCAPCQKSSRQCEYKSARKKRGRPPYIDEDDLAGAASAGNISSVRRIFKASLSHTGCNGTTPEQNSESSWQEHQLFPQGQNGETIYESVVQMSSDLVPRRQPSPPISTSFLFGSSREPDFRPSTTQIVQLWQIYLSNVDPLFKILHAPTIQNSVLGSIEKSSISSNEQALFSAIYFVSVTSIEDDECIILLHEERQVLLSRFKKTTENALCAANIVTTSEIEVLAAFVLYLISLQSLGEVESVWSMIGLGIRLSRKFKLSKLDRQSNVSAFEQEMRKRLWWAVVNLDTQTAESVDRDSDTSVQGSDLELVPDIGDGGLCSSVQNIPEHNTVMPDMLYVRLLAYFNTSVRSKSAPTVPQGLWQLMGSCEVPLSEKEDILEAVKKKINSEIIQHCDPSVPLQILTRLTSEILLTKASLQSLTSSHDWQSRFGRDARDARASKRSFDASLVLMESVSELFLHPTLRRWQWHFRACFPWVGLLPLTNGAKLFKLPADDEDLTRACTVLRAIFDHIMPSLNLSQRRRELSVSIRKVLHCNSTQPSNQYFPAEDMIATSVSRHMFVAQPGHGSNPHNALLPGMNYAKSDTEMNDGYGSGRDAGDIGNRLPIDWAELDMLMTDFCGL